MKKTIYIVAIIAASLLLAGCDSSTTGSVKGINSDSRTDDPKTERPYPDMDCADFSSHGEAQDFFEANEPGDPHNLDRDGDGIACESL